jgi:hypothetical protein
MLELVDSYRGLKFVLRYLREVPFAWFVLGAGIAGVGVSLSKALFAKRHLLRGYWCFAPTWRSPLILCAAS